ncbi:MAG: hypothetical protein BJ554DRAFT_4246 [Olpidium bornovanus]|uniref:STAS domain-containing protein n=1 Tax=Olpidium bornovanus TaxID=278681 RepID=A0A8H8A0E8_9FUNG|nr:MAG: hypothetical protein BJ554DRAFT_4246 [Olpidium bornovanus]
MRAWTDLFLLSLTFVTTLAVSVEVGTLLAITLSLVLAIKHTTKPQITILGRVRGTKDQYQSIRDYPAQAEHLHGTLIIKIEESLHFANTGQLKDRLRRVELFGDFSVHPSEAARLPPVLNVIFDSVTPHPLFPLPHDLRLLPNRARAEGFGTSVSSSGGLSLAVDFFVAVCFYPVCFRDFSAAGGNSAVQILLEIIQQYHKRHIYVAIVRPRGSVALLFRRAGISKLVGQQNFFDDVAQAIRCASQYYFFLFFNFLFFSF